MGYKIFVLNQKQGRYFIMNEKVWPTFAEARKFIMTNGHHFIEYYIQGPKEGTYLIMKNKRKSYKK